MLVALGLCSTPAWSQTETLGQGDPGQEMRDATAGLNPNRIGTGVLLNRTMLITDPHRFGGSGDTLTDWKGWEQQYWEFYNASLQPQGLLTRQELWSRIDAKFSQNAVPLLMLKYRYDELLPDAAAQGLITVDSTKEVMYDGPNLSRSPYSQGHVFSVAMALPTGEGPMAVYVGKEFWLGNETAPDNIWLDFGDGAGWRLVAMGSTVDIQVKPGGGGGVEYRAAGAAPTQTIYAYDPTDWSLAKTGLQYRSTQASVLPDVALGVLASRSWPGFTPSGPVHAQQGRAKAIAWIKYAQSNTTGKLRKPLVFVEGIDFAKNRNDQGGVFSVFFENYRVTGTGPIGLSSFTNPIQARGGFRNGAAGWNEMVDYNSDYKSLEKMGALQQSMQNGTAATDGDYDLIYLDFSDGASLIQHNAMVLVELLEWINKPVNRTANAEETVVIAASMGGQVARFGLAWMEQQGLCHNSKIYISVDSPHRGANVPIGLQHMFDRLQNIWIGSGSAEDGIKKLRREASQQMLVFNFDGGATGRRNQWQGWQNSANSYPTLLRKVATANGSGQAVSQPGMWPGMEILHTAGAGIITGPNHAYALPGTTSHGQNRVVFRYKKAISISGKWHQSIADASWGNYDTSPGSQARVAGDASDVSNQMKADWPTNTFMPTISALDVKDAGPVVNPYFAYNVQQQIPVSDRPNRAKYAFDAYFVAGSINEPHVQITNGQGSSQGNTSYFTDNSTWIRNELRESAHNMPAVLSSMYNFGNPYRHLLPSVQINTNGYLMINHWAMGASGGSGAYYSPAPGHFEVYTSSCATVVQVNDHGSILLGSSTAGVGNPASHPATLQMSANSLLDLRSGGIVTVENGSVLRIVAGATLVVRNGATLNVKGQLIVEAGAYICVENSGSIIVSSGGSYTVSPTATYSANPALNLTGLACGPPASTLLQASISSLNYTSWCTSNTGRNNYAQFVGAASGGTGAYTYRWYIDATRTGNSYQLAGTGATFGVCMNSYSSLILVKLEVTSGAQQAVAEYYASPQFREALYPNPADEYVDIAPEQVGAAAAKVAGATPVSAATPAPMDVTVYNARGKVVYTAEGLTDPLLHLNTRSWPAGLYQVKVRQGKSVTQRQLSVQH
ncbi:hypothetical protein GCM10022406_32960 [Hymenobacter algoricola]|uniref:Secretion system C-terminal sorting domain-containing protein n=1 Tax=Hymenobacter algoricola TaxID=486267 RepID=A0ABP7NMF1_9BACT